MIEMINKLFRTSRYLAHELGREPNPEEIANKMEVQKSIAAMTLISTRQPTRLFIDRRRHRWSEVATGRTLCLEKPLVQPFPFFDFFILILILILMVIRFR